MRLSANHNIDEYIAKAPDVARPILAKIRRLAAAQIPEAVEVISYQMPAFKDEKTFFYFAAFKNHIGIYPPLRGSAELLARLAPFSGPKGNLKFAYKNDIPYDLIVEVITALHQQSGLRK